MRVIAGRYGRRRLKTLPGLETRPMLDSLRETLFNVLQSQIAGKVFVDLYAGTGSVGIEALSRRATRAIFVEANPRAVEVLRENLASLGAENDAQVFPSTVGSALPQIEGDIFFLGPPYELTEEYKTTLQALGKRRPELVIAQHAKSRVLAEKYGSLRLTRKITHGSNTLSFYEPGPG